MRPRETLPLSAASVGGREKADYTAQRGSRSWETSYVAGDKLYRVDETDEVGIILEHAPRGGFPDDLVAEVVEQRSPAFR